MDFKTIILLSLLVNVAVAFWNTDSKGYGKSSGNARKHGSSKSVGHSGKSSEEISGGSSKDSKNSAVKDVASHGSPPPPPPPKPEPKPRPDSDNLDFVLRCPPEEAFRLIPYYLIEEKQKETGGVAQTGIQTAGEFNRIGNSQNFGWSNQRGRFPSDNERDSCNKCIEWKKGKKPTGENQTDKVVEAFWAWLGLSDCSTTSTSTSETETSGTGLAGAVLADLPMMDSPDLTTSCPLKTQITEKLTSFTGSTKAELDKYWRSLFIGTAPTRSP